MSGSIILSEYHEDHGTAVMQEVEKISQISDGYHTFNELYAYRMMYHALWITELYVGLKAAATGNNLMQEYMDKFDIHYSFKHADGKPCFDKENYFVVSCKVPTYRKTQDFMQITNHYKGEYEYLFRRLPKRERASEWDGHTPREAYDRMNDYMKANWS